MTRPHLVPTPAPAAVMALDRLALGKPWTAHEVVAPDDAPGRAQRLEQLGLLRGERVTFTASNPAAIRLHCASGTRLSRGGNPEAACIGVGPSTGPLLPLAVGD
jgi:Fe2+ transport system protein FeoA